MSRHGWGVLLASLHAAVAVLLPAVTGLFLGVIVALLTMNRRRGCNAMTRFLGWFGSLIAGMHVNITGLPAEGIKGPAIVVFNHQSGLDPIILCRALRADLVGIAKKELRYNPVLGPLLWFAGTLFFDREDQRAQRATYRPALEALGRGLIIVIAPEGRRQAAEPLAPFRTGAFRLALEAGVPLLPVVIHGASVLLAPRSTALHPGEVHVQVLPPVDACRWRGKPVEALATAVHSDMRAALCAGPGH